MVNVELKKEDFPKTIELINLYEEKFNDEKFKSLGKMAFKNAISELFTEFNDIGDYEINSFFSRNSGKLEFKAMIEFSRYIQNKMSLGLKKTDINVSEELEHIYFNFS